MTIVKKSLLRLALVAAFLVTMGAGFAEAQFPGTFGERFPDCSGNGFAGRNVLVAIGLTADQRLICFRVDEPGRAVTIGTITGFVGGETRMIGIDFRSSNNSLYGVGNLGNVYIIDQQTAVARRTNSLTVPLEGTFFGVDFNPVPDRLRIISDTGQNLRHNVDPGGTTIVDGRLSYTPTGTTPRPDAVGLTGAAYTNNDTNPNTGTTLYDIDSNLDILATQNPANAGDLQMVGALGVDTSPNVGFDIYTSENRFGAAMDNRGFASLTSSTNASQTGFFRIDLQTGAATFLGAFSTANVVTDIALPRRQQFSPFLLF